MLVSRKKSFRRGIRLDRTNINVGRDGWRENYKKKRAVLYRTEDIGVSRWFKVCADIMVPVTPGLSISTLSSVLVRTIPHLMYCRIDVVLSRAHAPATNRGSFPSVFGTERCD